MYSSFTSVTLSAIFGFAVALLGHTLDSLVYFAEKSHSTAGELLLWVTKLLPNLGVLDLKTLAARQLSIPLDSLLAHAVYALAYTAGLIALAAAIFSRRDLK
jgi:ABC-type transport system involved in multi-copper enzyme maturation permease subunit